MKNPVEQKAKHVARLAQLNADKERVAKKIVDVEALIVADDAAIAAQPKGE